jgi:hypothetical protein
MLSPRISEIGIDGPQEGVAVAFGEAVDLFEAALESAVLDGPGWLEEGQAEDLVEIGVTPASPAR